MFIPFAMLLTFATAADSEPSTQHFGTSLLQSAVLVENAILAHTSQLLADPNSASIHEAVEDVFQQLSVCLAAVNSNRADLIKINLYVKNEEVTPSALDFLKSWSPGRKRPAVSVVMTNLPAGSLLGIDAIFVVRSSAQIDTVTHIQVKANGKPQISLLPKGDAVYVSGQAEPGELAEATKRTLESLLKTLQHSNLGRDDIVRLKCFLQPMTDIEIVNREISNFFKNGELPAISHVEWIAGGTRPIEIELVAAAPLTESAETVSYLTPPEMKASPVYSRVARIHGNRRVYLSGLVAETDADAAKQVDSIYQQLIRQLKPTRSNLRHLVKATYFVSSPEVSTQLNIIRPHYYDPQRPPAASKAMVHGTGIAGRSISIDIIAAPEAPLVSVLTSQAEQLKPTRSEVYKNVSERDLQLHIFEPNDPQSADRRPVFLAIHGGGWTGGNAQTFYPFANHFANLGMVGMSLEYRLKKDAEGTTVFDSVCDAKSAVRWIRSNADRLGIDPKKIVVMGGSAGGHLAISTAIFQQVNDEQDDQQVSARPDAIIMMYPVIDTSARGYGQAKIGERWKELSPLHNVTANLPPSLIFHGTGDDVTPYTGAEQFQQKSLAAGNKSTLITYPGGRHGYIIFDSGEFKESLEKMEDFLKVNGF